MIIDTFANRLKIALKENDMKPFELAEKTGLDKSLISNYLSGNYKAKQDKLSILGKVLNVNEVWLMGYDVPMERDFVSQDKNTEDLKKNALKLGAQYVYIDTDEPLTKEDVLKFTSDLLEVIEEQKKKDKDK